MSLKYKYLCWSKKLILMAIYIKHIEKQMKNIVTELISLHYGRFWCFTVMIQNDHRRPSWIVSLDKKFPMGLMNNCAKWEHLYWEYRLEIFRCYGLWYLDFINAKISILKKMDIGQYDPHPTIFTNLLIMRLLPNSSRFSENMYQGDVFSLRFKPCWLQICIWENTKFQEKLSSAGDHTVLSPFYNFYRRGVFCSSM